MQLQCMAAVLPHLTGYIWQQDAFTLHTSKAVTSPWNKASVKSARSSDNSSAPEHLWGLARFGDNIEDEWLIVWLLHQITIKVDCMLRCWLGFSESWVSLSKLPGQLVLLQFSSVCARVWDNDGDFLLIEAAYSLPKWLKPETSRNRVWLRNGQLHIVPLPNRHHPTLPSSPTIQEALQILSSDSVNTIAKAGMQEAIRLKIKGYPRKAQADMHRARCLLPAKIAHVLQHKPQLVSPAVQTFHYRDVQDMRAAAKLAHFQPQVSSACRSCSGWQSVAVGPAACHGRPTDHFAQTLESAASASDSFLHACYWLLNPILPLESYACLSRATQNRRICLPILRG